MNDLARGAVAGLAATLPMTAAMLLMRRGLPWTERGPLPPREITEEVADRAGVGGLLGESGRDALTTAAHFGYGAAAGALYGPLSRSLPVPGAALGPAYGLAVWAGGYLGWLPALGILPPATEDSPRRSALMIAAHLVWGLAAGTIADALADNRTGPPGNRAERR